jgi:hypothetical protein
VLLVAQSTILANLKDPDVSIRRRALDLLFTMCDGGAAVEVVEELVSTRLQEMRHASLRQSSPARIVDEAFAQHGGRKHVSSNRVCWLPASGDVPHHC